MRPDDSIRTANPLRSPRQRWFVGVIALISCLQLGCAANQTRLIRASRLASVANRKLVQVKPVRHQPRRLSLAGLRASLPQPSKRTELVLRRYDLLMKYEEDPDAVVAWFQKLAQDQPTIEEIHGLAEIAEIQANWSARTGDNDRAIRLYATAVIHAYQFLFDPKLNVARNAYDPQFRNICDVYNRSLEALLREVRDGQNLQTEKKIRIGNEQQGIEFTVRIEGRWRDQKFDRFELVSDYQASGLDNQYHTYGLGVPLIAVRKQQAVSSSFEKYYPPEITIPMTAFMHLKSHQIVDIDGPRAKIREAVLTLYDPLEQTIVQADSKVVPLESDITTPLAYGLRDPLLSKGVLATASLLDADFAPESFGMFMLEPYDPTKIPVLMVHGFWSSPVTWVHMFNDLRANRDIHENYQFWFYSYPTGQPFWISAQKMRQDLAQIRRELDPNGDSKSLDQMVLVGHSMGGLMSVLQTVESENHFWNAVGSGPIENLTGDSEVIQRLRDTFYFSPNPAIDRVITLATPFKGSEFANAATQWVSGKLFMLPSATTSAFQELEKLNEGKLRKSFLATATSIDSLAPSDPVLVALGSARRSKSVQTHNIIGKLPKSKFRRASNEDPAETGDGVVSVHSASNEFAESQVYVPAEHSRLHQHPSSILEVRRILIEHLVEHDRIRSREIPEPPTALQANRLQQPLRRHWGLSAEPVLSAERELIRGAGPRRQSQRF